MYRSTMNTNVITALGMCKVCTEAIHSVARKRQDWTCESTCEHENAKTRKRENGRNQPVDAKTAKTRKRRKQENRENGENAKTAKTRKRENGENAENPKTAKSVPVFWFSISRFLVFSVFSVFWFSRFLVFSFRWPHPSGQVAFFMSLEGNQARYVCTWPYRSRGPPAFGALALQDVGDVLRASQVNCLQKRGIFGEKTSWLSGTRFEKYHMDSYSQIGSSP